MRLVWAVGEDRHGLCSLTQWARSPGPHAGCPFTLVLRHSPNGQGFAAPRADEQPLQGFHFAPAARLPCLHDTHLQTPHTSMAFGPVSVPPLESRAGARVRPQTLFCAVLRRDIAAILAKILKPSSCTPLMVERKSFPSVIPTHGEGFRKS